MSEIRCVVCEAETDGFLCKDPCLSSVVEWITDVPSLAHELSIVATRQAKVYRANARTAAEELDEETAEQDEAERHKLAADRRWGRLVLRHVDRSALVETELPIRLDARDRLSSLLNVLTTWARHLNGSRLPEGVADTTGLPRDIPGLVEWFVQRANAIRYDEAAGELYAEIESEHYSAQRTVDRASSRVYAGPCDADILDEDGNAIARCDRKLYAYPRSKTIRCDGYDAESVHGEGCGAIWQRDQRKDWIIATVSESLLPLTDGKWIPDLLGIARPDRRMWDKWVARGRLTVHTVDRNGVELFSGSEIVDVLLSWARDATRRADRNAKSA